MISEYELLLWISVDTITIPLGTNNLLGFPDLMDIRGKL